MTYQLNPGYGGETLYAVEVLYVSTVVIDTWADLAEALDGSGIEVEDLRDRGYGWPYEAVEARPEVRAWLARSTAWAVYEDSYPEGCTTWQALRVPQVRMTKIEART